jgi:hypothetical protein
MFVNVIDVVVNALTYFPTLIQWWKIFDEIIRYGIVLAFKLGVEWWG